MLIGGTGPLNLQLACELLACGVKPVAVVEAAPRPGPAAWRDACGGCCAHAPGLLRDGVSMLATLKRAGVPVLWSVHDALIAAQGNDSRPDPLRHRHAQHGERTLAADVVALNLGFQPEAGLARALGIPHRFVDVGLGHLATETDPDGRTALDGVFAVGDGAALGGARVAMARGRLAGLAAARDLGAARAGRSCRPRRAGACAGIPGRAVAIVPAAAAVRPPLWPNDTSRVPLRGSHCRPAACRNWRAG